MVVIEGMTQAKFKTYTSDQLQLLPQSWDEKIKQGHRVRIVDQVVDNKRGGVKPSESLLLNKANKYVQKLRGRN